jgi:hypothetical protein
MLALLAVAARAEDPPAGPLLDKAIKAVGGEERLGKIKAVSYKSKAKITIEGNENEMKIDMTLQGFDHYRSEFEGKFGENEFKGLTVLSGDKAWRKFGEGVQQVEGDDLKNEKRRIYLAACHLDPLLLKGKGFKVESAKGATVEGKPADGLKVTGPDGKESTLYIDHESGLPVRQVARVAGWMGDEYEQESTFSGYKEFDGVKVPTKVNIKRDGEDFVKEDISDVKYLDNVPPDTFAEPK